jgi:O-antigen/teichoic acid export membrane protein
VRTAASGVKPTFILMSGRMVAFAATFLLPVVLARVLTPAEFGTYRQLFLLYATLYYIAQFGIAESLYYFLPSASTCAGRYLANAMFCLAATGLAGFLFLQGARGALAGWLNNPALEQYTVLVGVFLLLMLIASVLEITMVTRGRYLLASATYGISDVARAAAFAIPAAVFRRIDALLAGAILFAALRLIVTLGYVARTFRGDLGPDQGALRRQLHYTVPFGVAVVLEICQANLHLFAVSYYVDAATFAIYAVGCLQVPIVDLVATSAGNVMMVRMADGRQAGRPSQSLTIWREGVRHLALVLVPLVVLLIVVAEPLIVLLFTGQYRAAAPIFTIWSLAILPAIFMTDAALRAHAQTRVLVVLNAVRLAVVALGIHWSITTFGLAGAVVVTLVAAVVTKVLALTRVARVLDVPAGTLVPWTSLGAIALAAVVAGTIAAALVAAIPGPALPALAITTAVYAAVYFAFIWRLGALTPRERRALAERLQQWIGQSYVWNSGHRQPE